MSACVATEDQVLEALQRLAPASSADIAAELGCGERTARRRISALKARGVVRFKDRQYVVAQSGPTYAALLDERDRLVKELARLQRSVGGAR